MVVNYTVQDILGILLAFILFLLIFLSPGYVIGWCLNIFDFRKRLTFTKGVIGVALSNAFSPILFFLAYRLGSGSTAKALLLGLAAISAALIIPEIIHRHQPDSRVIRQYRLIALGMGMAWVTVSVFLLTDLQIGNRLYYTVASNDLTTRVSVVDAITRTGVPPINPSYFPGHPQHLTFLYYFWYILGSLVDQAGGDLISPYQAMLASSIWCGLSLMAVAALYVRLRNQDPGSQAWRTAFLTIQIFLIGGLDFIPVVLLMVESRLLHGFTLLNGGVEGWNSPIMGWLHAVVWVPHHVAGALACMTGLLALLYSIGKNPREKVKAMIVVAFAFASALGLTVWVTLCFGLFCVVWLVVTSLNERNRDLPKWAILGSLLALGLATPFIIDLLETRTLGAPGAFLLPIGFSVRPFVIISEFMGGSPGWLQGILNLTVLPINYMLELGLFLFIALIWLQKHGRSFATHPYYQAEMMLLIVTVVFLSFFYSTLIYVNDLGIRGWLPAEFILVIWGSDLLSPYAENGIPWLPDTIERFSVSRGLGASLSLLLMIGLLTTGMELFATRTWPMMVDLGVAGFPNNLSPDTQLGKRTYAARKAYDFIGSHLPLEIVVQSNPSKYLDRPAGLYGSRQMAISDRTAYGIDPQTYEATVEKVSKIFTPLLPVGWTGLDAICLQNSIQAIIVDDTDPLWQYLPVLEEERPALYKNAYYELFLCGI